MIAGVLVSFCIPARPAKGPREFLRKMPRLLDYFEKREDNVSKVLADSEQHEILEEVQETAKQSTTTLQRLEKFLDLPVALFVLPVFALINAGVLLNYTAIQASLQSPLSWGIITGLLFGKPLGILLMSFMAYKFNLGELPKQTSFSHLVGASLLAGIGFTMSLFISNLAFEANSDLLELAKSGILFGSFLSGIGGIAWCLFLPGNKNS